MPPDEDRAIVPCFASRPGDLADSIGSGVDDAVAEVLAGRADTG